MGWVMAFSLRVLGFYIGDLGLSAEALGRESASQGTHQRHIENQRTGFQLCLGALGRDQLIFCRQYVEVGGQRTVVAPADNLMGFGRGGDCCSRRGELPVEGLAAGRGVGHFVQRVRQRRVVGGDAASYSAWAPRNWPCRRSVLKIGSEIAGPTLPRSDPDLVRLSMPSDWRPTKPSRFTLG